MKRLLIDPNSSLSVREQLWWRAVQLLATIVGGGVGAVLGIMVRKVLLS